MKGFHLRKDRLVKLAGGMFSHKKSPLVVQRG
jgi:hypothetical protein